MPKRIPAPLRRRVEALRNTGHFGNIISQHRALLTMPLRRRDYIPAMLLAAVLLAVYILLLDYVAAGWGAVLRACLDWFGYEQVGLGWYGFSIAGYDIVSPYVRLGAAVPSSEQWSAAVVLIAVVLILSLFLPDRLTPLTYLIRALALIHATAVVYFTFWPEHFPYSLASYHALMMLAGMIFIAVVPILYGLIYFIFDTSLINKLAVTVVTMMYLFIVIPLQYFAHAYLIHQLSLLYMPLLFLMFGLMIDVFLLIAFYSMAMSGDGKAQPPQQRRSSRVHFPIDSDELAREQQD